MQSAIRSPIRSAISSAIRSALASGAGVVRPEPVDWLTITGTTTENQTLTAALGGGAPVVTAYQWLRGYTPIGGATSSTYVLTDADVGRVIRVVATHAGGEGYSLPTASIAGVNDTPTGSVTISGTATQGQVLTAVTTTIADPDGLGPFGYQWRRAGTPISGATSSTYTLVQADVGAVMSVVVSWTDLQGFSESLTSADTSAVANVNDAPTGAPTISGTPTQGQTLTVVTTSIADADGLGTFAYQWLRNGSNISGATSTTYTLVQADVGTAVSCRVSYTDALGTAESLTSATVTVANINDAPGGSVVITGTPNVGQVLTADTSTVTDVDGLGSFTWQWKRDGSNISGATASTYTTQVADDGTTITVTVSWIDAYGAAESLTSAGVAVSDSFDPLTWYAASEQGAWPGPSDLSTMFQDSAGTTPVTAVEQPVGLILDRRLGLALGAELTTNGEFATDTDWTKGAGVTISGGKANFSAATGYAIYRTSNPGVAAGGLYEVTYTVSGYVSGAIRPYIGATATFGAAVSANGTYTVRMGPAAGSEIGFNVTSAFTGSIDSISVKAVTGNHAFQATSTSRPTLKSDSSYIGLGFLGSDDNLASAGGGGGTTGGTWVIGFRPDLLGSAQTIWSDAGTNTGYRIRFTAANQIEFSAGNGSSYTSATVATALTLNQRCVISAWHDGVNLSVQVNNGTVATAAFATATAGTAAFTVGKDNGAASGYLTGRVYEAIYVRNIAKTSDLASAKAYVAAASGVTL